MSTSAWERVAVCVVTLNEEENLARCLASVVPCGEIVVVDSGSTDGTRAVAERFGARWLSRPWEGFGPQRTVAGAASTAPFVLYLDADEWLGPGLREEIASALEAPGADDLLGVFRRQSEFLGRTVRHGDWSGDFVARLTPRGRGVWRGAEPHPRLEGDDLKARRFRCPLLHRPYRDLAAFSRKIEGYARTWAQEAARVGQRGSRAQGLLRAGWRLFRGLALRGGVLDGRRGLIIAWQNARMVYLKHLFLSQGPR
ncbi:MAG: glycosyltransferase family 2 protein [Verrucomicrobiae bacterium]|nr:glycosyltransferase family 2 protein [Verrucomicrobiae bacterium]